VPDADSLAKTREGGRKIGPLDIGDFAALIIWSSRETMNHLPVIVTRRRLKDLWRASFYVRCWSCDSLRLGPYPSRSDANVMAKTADHLLCPASEPKAPSL